MEVIYQMAYLLYSYPKCSTCQNAIKWLESYNIAYEVKDIKENPPTKEEIKSWKEKTDLPLEKFFNTSGLVYREMNLKEIIKVMTQEEIYDCLASDGMLVKRPVLVMDHRVLFGFKEDEWKKELMS